MRPARDPLISTAAAATLLSALALGAPLAAAEPPAYQAGDERIELEVVPDLVTLGRAVPDGAEKVVAALGAEGAGAEAVLLENGVWVVDLAPGEPGAGSRAELGRGGAGDAPLAPKAAADGPAAAAATREARLRRQQAVLELALADPAVDWAYPAYRNPETGTVLLATPRIVVAVKPGIDPARLATLLPGSVRLVRALRAPGRYLLELAAPRSDDPLEVSVRLARDEPWVRWAEPDFVQRWRRPAVPDDPLFSSQWHLRNTGQGGGVPGADARLAGAWDVETGDGSVVIAVLDDGVELAHPDLPVFSNPGEVLDGVDNDANGLVDDLHGWDFFGGDNDPDPCTSAGCAAGIGSHGTAVAGVAAARGDDGTGVTGACQDCRILPVRIASHATGFFTSNAAIADAIDYAAGLADVLNNSWGGGSPAMAITTAIQDADAGGRGGLGAPVFFASGNSASGYQSFGLSGISAGTWTFTWTFSKNASVSSGLDGAWLDDVVFPDGTREGFEGCSGLPAGWSTFGDASWTVLDDETRARSRFGGRCSAGAGAIGHGQSTSISVTRGLAVPGTLQYSLWRSSEPAGPLTVDDQSGAPECFDFVELTASNGVSTFGPFLRSCGTYSNQGNALQDGAVSYPASVAEAIAVGASTNLDGRSDYGQWQAGVLDFVCPTSGGSLGVTTTDLTGAVGYSATDEVSGFGGTSSASPLCAGVAGLILSRDPGRTSAEVRTLMQESTRKIGSLPYVAGGNDVYGFGAVSAELALENLLASMATLVVRKRTIPGGDPASFTFTGDLAASLGDGQEAATVVPAGSYGTIELVPPGWSLLDVTCDDADSTGDPGTAAATFHAAAGETVTCVFVNCSDGVGATVDLSGVTVTAGMSETFEACDTLSADTFESQPGSTVTFRAGRTIVLEDGVAIGGSFRAEIAGSP